MACAVSIPQGSYGCDTSARLTAAQAVKLAKAYLPIEGGKPVAFIWRYLPRAGMSMGAVSKEEIDALVAAGVRVLLVQYGPPKAGWVVSADMGVADGKAAAAAAQSVGYPAGCHIAVDLEGLKSVGQAVVDYLTAWGAEIRVAGYKACAYVGYAPGLTPAQFGFMADAGKIDAFWSDAAARTPAPGHPFDCKQFWTIRLMDVDNIPFDPDEALTGRLVAMGPDPAAGDGGDPVSEHPHDETA